MGDKVWVGKKAMVLSLEELERNHFKDRDGYFWCSKNKDNQYGNDSVSQLRYGSCISPPMQKYCGKICEVAEVREEFFKIKEDGARWDWHLWMVKELVLIQDILEAE